MSNLAILADSKTQNASLFPVHAIFCHDCPLTVKLACTQCNLVNKKTWKDSAPIDMFLSAVSFLVVVQLSSEVLEGLMNNTVYKLGKQYKYIILANDQLDAQIFITFITILYMYMF
jgi:hypothetical protein